jgi:hypothetical protein
MAFSNEDWFLSEMVESEFFVRRERGGSPFICKRYDPEKVMDEVGVAEYIGYDRYSFHGQYTPSNGVHESSVGCFEDSVWSLIGFGHLHMLPEAPVSTMKWLESVTPSVKTLRALAFLGPCPIASGS